MACCQCSGACRQPPYQCPAFGRLSGQQHAFELYESEWQMNTDELNALRDRLVAALRFMEEREARQ